MKINQKTLMDNGQTVIRHVQNPERHKDTLVVTFAEMMMNDPEKPGFAQDFLMRQGVDIIAVQKRSENWYQDLKTDHFRRAVEKVSGSYNRIVCYGLSMGAFASLYFGGSINASIIAVSPLCSIHPLYPELGHVEYRRKVPATQCDLADAVKCDQSVYIIYDPLVPGDALYIDNEVKPAFPNATYALAPGSGHPSAMCLNYMGILRPAVLDFIEDGTTTNIAGAMRPHRHRSSFYMENMAEVCLRHHRPAKAMTYFDRAVELAPAREGVKSKREKLQKKMSEAIA